MFTRLDEIIEICVRDYSTAGYEIHDEYTPELRGVSNSIDVIQLEGELHLCGLNRVEYAQLYRIHIKCGKNRKELQRVSEELQLKFGRWTAKTSVKKFDGELYYFIHVLDLYRIVEDAPLVEFLERYIERKGFTNGRS